MHLTQRGVPGTHFWGTSAVCDQIAQPQSKLSETSLTTFLDLEAKQYVISLDRNFGLEGAYLHGRQALLADIGANGRKGNDFSRHPRHTGVPALAQGTPPPMT